MGAATAPGEQDEQPHRWRQPVPAERRADIAVSGGEADPRQMPGTKISQEQEDGVTESRPASPSVQYAVAAGISTLGLPAPARRPLHSTGQGRRSRVSRRCEKPLGASARRLGNALPSSTSGRPSTGVVQPVLNPPRRGCCYLLTCGGGVTRSIQRTDLRGDPLLDCAGCRYFVTPGGAQGPGSVYCR